MSIADFLKEAGGGLAKAGKVAGAVLEPVAKSLAEEESGELPKIQEEKRQKQSKMESAGIAAKAQELESQLEMGRKYGTLTPEQQQQYVKSITDLYSHPSQMGTLVQKLHKAIHPHGATYQPTTTPLKDATPEVGTFATEEAAREKAAKELASARRPSKEYASPDNTRRDWFQPGEEPENWNAVTGAPKSPTGKSPVTPGNQLPQGAVGPDGQVIPDAVRNSKQEFQEWNGAWYPAQNPSDKAPTTKVALIHGKSYIMGWNPGTHQFDRNMGEAPPNYAQIAPNIKNMELASKTNTRMGPDGVMHDYQYNPQTREFDIDMGTKPTGTAAQQTFQGEAIQQAGKKVIEDINAHKEILGNLSSYVTQYLNGTPISDPNAATILADLKSFASMQPAMHAFRSTTSAQAFAKIVGGLANDPDSTIATIKSLSGMAGIISSLGTGGGQNGSSYPKPGAKPVGQILPRTGAHQIGETKKFPNGKTGMWDGQGWVAQ